MRRAVLIIFLLAAPTLVEAGANRLQWQDNSANEANFHIERKTAACGGSEAFAEIAAVGANVTTFLDTAVQEGVTYCYRVAASNPAGTSAWSNEADRTVPFVVPAPPSSLSVTEGSS